MDVGNGFCFFCRRKPNDEKVWVLMLFQQQSTLGFEGRFRIEDYVVQGLAVQLRMGRIYV